MSKPSWPPEDESSTREIATFNLREDRRIPGLRGDVADAVAALLEKLVAEINRRGHEDGMPPIVPPEVGSILASATATLTAAAEGKLKAASLDAALKASQIELNHAEAHERAATARLREAEAERTRAEAAKLRAEVRKAESEYAMAELRQVLSFIVNSLGVPIAETRLEDGRIAIAVGENLVCTLSGRDEPVGTSSTPADLHQIEAPLNDPDIQSFAEGET